MISFITDLREPLLALQRSLLRSLYPALLRPDLISASDIKEVLYKQVPQQQQGGAGGAHLEEEGTTADFFESMVSDAQTNFSSSWSKLVRVGEDGDICWAGYKDTTLLDVISRGLDCRDIEDKRRGDFDPSHRLAIYTDNAEDLAGAAPGVQGTYTPPAAGDEAAGDDEAAATTTTTTQMSYRGCAGPPRFISVVSQMDVLDLMVKSQDSLGAFPGVCTLEELGCVDVWDTITVDSTLPAAASFALMHNACVSGVAVLDASRRFMIGNLSLSDICAVGSVDELASLAMPTGDFLKQKVWRHRAASPKSGNGAEAEGTASGDDQMLDGSYGIASGDDQMLDGSWRPPVMLPRTASLLSAMQTMATAKVHRVWVSDASGRGVPVGVITVTDVMRVFALDPESSEGRARLTW